MVALIHNNHAVRNAYVMPHLRQLCAQLNAAFTEVSWQPPLQAHSTRTALCRDWLYARLELAWARYRELSTRKKLRIMKSHLRHRLMKHAAGGAELAQWRRRSFIETVVTAKHICSWEAFLESGADVLICCEDDVVFKSDSTRRLYEYVESLGQSPLDMLFADLAGGVPLELLDIGNLAQATEAQWIVYRKPTTNTACAYILSRALAEDFVRQILIKPKLRLIGIDWMMNTLFMELAGSGKQCGCIHFSPSIFGHGTFTGAYVSWQAAMQSG